MSQSSSLDEYPGAEYSNDSGSPSPSLSTSSTEFVQEIRPEVLSPARQRVVGFKIEDTYEAPKWNIHVCLRRYSLLKLEFKKIEKTFREAFQSNMELYYALIRVERLSFQKYERVLMKLMIKTREFDQSYNVAKRLFQTPFPDVPEPERNANKFLLPHASRMNILRLKFDRKERFMAKVVAVAGHMEHTQSMLKRLRNNVPILTCIFSTEHMHKLVGASVQNIWKILVKYN